MFRLPATCECRSRCKAQLAPWPDLERGCKKACNGANKPLDACDYLENFLVGGDQTQIAYYGIDCDPTQGGGITELPEYQALTMANSALVGASGTSSSGPLLDIETESIVFLILGLAGMLLIYFGLRQ